MTETRTALLFPGQGSQRPGMGRPWQGHPSWDLVSAASAVSGRDVAHLLCHADARELQATRNAQLATLVMSLMVLDALRREGMEPDAYAGHSLGEYTALVAAGAIGFDDGIRLVAARGEAMRRAGEQHAGTMAAIGGADDDRVEVACARTDGDVWVANYNAPGQVVIAGEPGAVDAATAEARHLGARKVLRLPVSGAFHTPLMAPARAPLRDALAAVEIRPPDRPVIANVDAMPHADPQDWSALLAAQLCSPVRWRQSLYRLEEQGTTTYVELGAGGVLTGLARRTVTGNCLSIATPADLDALAAARPAAAVGWHEGEHLHARERLIVSPGSGIFTPAPVLRPGSSVALDELIGRVGEREVRSPFTGPVAGVLAVAGERVAPNQPIAWVRVS
jgi:[acyl-carrier-protein] S-malonyltransferase